ncbi:GNAT family N-acetyltransferase [Streptomyces hoynatensis]|uniref:GNAT family N-acetyltransferase n=1 Tax=Streptomyces hoynatensis TaxID=1141874 RepID=A0A3A9YXD0_9ACTN|nr:GNAT family N-acetyltransferase [Streptomyces hoynatensis]RKN40540.1 GNAT family N-acetyltransferase [Streptomyces hoynatensis]
MDVSIRRAEPQELAAVGELTAEVYLADGLLAEGADDPYLSHLRDAAGRAAHAEVLVALDPADPAAGPLGTVTFVGRGGKLAEVSGEGEAEFRMLAVRPEARGRGVGEALVRECLRRARALGRKRVLLSSQLQMHTAHRLYRRLGFVRAPERDWEPVPGLMLHAFAHEFAADPEPEHNI